MKKICLFIICLPILVLSQPNNECYRSSNKEFKDSVIEIMFTLVNEHRVSHNLHELKWCKKMQISCLSQSKYLAHNGNTITHVQTNKKNPYYTGADPWDRTKFKMCSENILARYEFNGKDALPWMNSAGLEVKSAAEIALKMFTQWKTSPGHNKNMLDKQWNYFAFDYYGHDAKEKYHDCFLATQLFR
jgi:uncharacterized protein YkwD